MPPTALDWERADIAANACIRYAQSGSAPDREAAIDGRDAVSDAGLREILSDSILYANAAWTALQADWDDPAARPNQTSAIEEARKILDRVDSNPQPHPLDATKTIHYVESDSFWSTLAGDVTEKLKSFGLDLGKYLWVLVVGLLVVVGLVLWLRFGR